MPRLVRFVLCHALVGLSIAVAFVGALLAFNVSHLTDLVLHVSNGLLGLLVLTLLCTVTFSSLQIGMAVMLLAAEEKKKKGGGGGLGALMLDLFRPPPAVVPVKVRAR